MDNKKDKLKQPKGYLKTKTKKYKDDQPDIASSLKSGNKKSDMPTVPYQYKSKVAVVSPLSKQAHADGILLVKNRNSEIPVNEPKFLSETTVNYYGEDRNMPIRIYQRPPQKFDSRVNDSFRTGSAASNA